MNNNKVYPLALSSLFFIAWLSSTCSVAAQELSGRVVLGKTSTVLQGVTVSVPTLGIGVLTNEKGEYTLRGLPEGVVQVRVSFVGFVTLEESVTILKGEQNVRDFVLYEDVLNLGEVVVTGTRTQISRYETPVIVNTISNRTFEATQSLSISEGLSFSPGLRLENNCQNCGFTQLRMNGLDGAYSQILINSRPVFSALAGVYGLEMLPANMVDRIEVVRGGGSVLYGGNAIAGTVNIITKDPIQNSFEIGLNQSFINAETPDRTLTVNGAIVSDDLKKGITFFGFNRERRPWDANADGFSEMTQLRNTTFGLDAFWNTSETSKLRAGVYAINEFRRGGNAFDRPPHQADVAEQLQHSILSANLSYEQYSTDLRHKVSVYGSAQWVNRDSYYGAGGRVLGPGDALTEADLLAINAYGVSQDASVVTGVQYNYEFSKRLLLTSGTEYIYNNVTDAMPGYGRQIAQQVGTLGSYAQLEVKPTDKLTFLLGGRFDYLRIHGDYTLAEEQLENQRNLGVFVPRLSALYSLSKQLKLRASFAQGYRGPQAFDEDLHIETVGGAARFIRLAPDLLTERSNSTTLSLNYEKMIGRRQMNFVLEGFHTQLLNPFILSDQQELPSGVAVITKRNGSGATVAGLNLEGNIALGRSLILQSGATFQVARYAEPEILWEPEATDGPTPATVVERILRTPNAYGFYSLTYNPTKAMSLSYSGVLTGRMLVPHVIDPETERTVVKETPRFFEQNLKISYTIRDKQEDYRIQLFGGVQNILNSFQRDFDLGPERDAGYVYGPVRPRTLFMGLKIGFN